MRRGLQLALGALATLASGALPAMASSGSIADVAPLGDGIFTATFSAASDRCDAGGSCGWFPYATEVAPAERCDPPTPDATRVYSGATHDAPGADGPAKQAFYPDTEGPFKLCLYVAHTVATEPVVEYVYTPPVQNPRLTRRDALDEARRFLERRFPWALARARRLRLSCSRVDTWTIRCRAGWRSGRQRYRGAVTVEAVSASELRVRSTVAKRG